ncbi:hypothetical protein [Nitrosomonas eutropha]|uniref:hypothetical protein n=1 Tax=Nitrosomonas eutropha TaxID=916 RepID=UPI002108D098|nr:hypothetical protein [Nitrosomonas eutropha]
MKYSGNQLFLCIESVYVALLLALLCDLLGLGEQMSSDRRNISLPGAARVTLLDFARY